MSGCIIPTPSSLPHELVEVAHKIPEEVFGELTDATMFGWLDKYGKSVMVTAEMPHGTVKASLELFFIRKDSHDDRGSYHVLLRLRFVERVGRESWVRTFFCEGRLLTGGYGALMLYGELVRAR